MSAPTVPVVETPKTPAPEQQTEFSAWRKGSSQEPAKPEAAPAADKPPEQETKSEEPKPAPESQETKDVPGDGEVEKKRQGGFQKRIDDLTREKYQKDALLADRDRQLSELLQRLEQAKAPESPKPVVLSGAPELKDFENYDQFLAANTAFMRQSVLQEIRQEEQTRKTAEIAAQRVQKWTEKVTAAAKQTEDMMETLQAVRATPQMFEVISEMEVGPQVAYYLGKHPDEAVKLSQLTVTGMARELGKLEASIQLQEKNKDKPREPKAATLAPEPITPVKGSASADAPADITDFSSWRKWANKKRS